MKKLLILLITVIGFTSISAQKYECNVNGLNIRSEPNINGKIIGILHDGEVINVKEINNSWASFFYQKKKVFVNVKYLKKLNIEPESLIVRLVKKVYSYGFKDSELYLILIPGIIFTIIGYYIWAIEDLIFNIDEMDNNIPSLFLIFGAIFGASTAIWETKIFNYLNNFSLIPNGKGFIVWVLWILAAFIIVTNIAFIIKSFLRTPMMAIFRILLTLFLAFCSLLIGAIIFYLFVSWLKGIIGSILIILFLYFIIFSNGDSGGPDFTIKDKYGEVFKVWSHKN